MFVTPNFCISIVFNFSWELKWPQEKQKTMLMQNFGVTNKEHYGMLWYFWGIIFPTGTFYKDQVGTKIAALKKCVITFPLATLTKGIMLRLNFILGLIFVFPLQSNFSYSQWGQFKPRYFQVIPRSLYYTSCVGSTVLSVKIFCLKASFLWVQQLSL